MVIPTVHSDMSPRELLTACGGYYKLPRDDSGRRTGPFVGYAGTYQDTMGETRQYVGEDFADYAVVEEWPAVVDGLIVPPLLRRIEKRLGRGNFTFCGLPEGGKSLADHLATASRSRYLFPEKKVTQTASATLRELSELQFRRHHPQAGEEVIVVEDVCNNFSTAQKSINEITSYGAVVIGIVCFLNRSVDHQGWFTGDSSYPVIGLWEEPMPQWRQDDPEVAEDLVRLGARLKPKDHRDELQRLMALT